MFRNFISFFQRRELFYLSKWLLAKTAKLIRIVIIEIKGFVEENISYTVFANLKKEKKKIEYLLAFSKAF